MARKRILDCCLHIAILPFLLCFTAQAIAADVPNTWKDPLSLSSIGNLESKMLEMTNQNRIFQGLGPLVPDEALTQLARVQSAGMANQGFISHVLPSGDLKTRMSIGGYRYKVARENVASASSINWAQNALMQSPAHKDNILASDVTRVGIGIVRCPPPYEKDLFITEIFAAPHEEPQPFQIQETLLNRIEELRRNGAGSLLSDPLLEKLAQDSVQSEVMKEYLGSRVASSAVELHRNGISRVGVNIQMIRDPQNLKIVSSGSFGQEARAFGTAFRPVIDNNNEPAFLVLTVIGFAN